MEGYIFVNTDALNQRVCAGHLQLACRVCCACVCVLRVCAVKIASCQGLSGAGVGVVVVSQT